MKFIKLPAGTGGFDFEELLARFFPPVLTKLDPEAHKQVLAYQYRINRKGIERNPAITMGARIVSVSEGPARMKAARGTRESRAEIYA
jgi:hypothetical protein